MTVILNMKLIDIIRYLKGYVVFTATGGFPERFINLCNINGIRTWNLNPDIGYVSGCISASNFRKIRRFVKSSGIHVKIVKKEGLPFLIRKYSSRKFLFAGIIFYFIFIFIMNQFVWIIDITGTETISREEILSTAKEYSLYPGIFAARLDESAVSRSCINHFNDKIVWMAINVKGSKAVIEMRDFVDEHEDSTYGNPCNIVADFQGKILSIETYNGEKAVNSGSGVKKGDLLISGVIENRDLSCNYVEARGKITALHSVSFSKSYNKSSEATRQISSIKEKYKINFLWADIPLYKSNGFETIYSFSKKLSHNNIHLPFGIELKALCNFSKPDSMNIDFLTVLDCFISEYYYSFRNTNILNADFKVSNNKDLYSVCVNSDCIDFIGVKKDIYAEKNQKIY